MTWNGKAYRYVMFFLGTEQDNTHNQMGLALADSLDGPWTKYPQPLVTYPYPYPVPVAQQCWGVGQPSATTVDDHGHILLFYTQGGCDRTWARRSEIEIGNLDAPVVKAPIDLPVAGLIDGRGTQDLINSFDVAYDPSRDRFYIVRERHAVPGAPDDLEVDSIAADAIWSGVGTWRFEAALTPMSPRPRHHRKKMHGPCKVFPARGLLIRELGVRGERARVDLRVTVCEGTCRSHARARAAYDRKERESRLVAAVRSLPVGPRQVMLLLLEGLSHREIAEVLGTTENNVAVRASRARAAVRALIEADDTEAGETSDDR